MKIYVNLCLAPVLNSKLRAPWVPALLTDCCTEAFEVITIIMMFHDKDLRNFHVVELLKAAILESALVESAS